MKCTKIKPGSVLLFLLAICTNGQLLSQNAWLPPFEGTEVNPPPSGIDRSLECNLTGPDFVNKYSRLSYYFDNYDIHPVVTIPVIINVWQKDDFSENWQETSAHIDRLKKIIEYTNAYYSNHCPPSDPVAGVVDRPDSKISIELVDINFYQNSAMWDKGSGGQADADDLNDEAELLSPGSDQYLNIHITGGYYVNPNVAGFGEFPLFNDAVSHQVVLFNNEALPAGDFLCGKVLAHEIGHNLDLHHTYSDCPPYADDPDYPDDIFIDGTYLECPHASAYNDDPYDNIGNGSTNNIMGGTKYGCYFSPLQIATMHRAIAIKSIRNYVKCETYPVVSGTNYAEPLVIDNDELWDFSIRFYNPISILDGVKLTITCRIIMSNQQNILVEPGGTLTVDGGIITNPCEDDFWRGVEVRGNSSSHQFNFGSGYDQGLIIMKNDAIIEHAQVAVALWKPNVWTTTGGIILAENAIFRNNKKDVEFINYSNDHAGTHYDNKGRFTNVTFTWDDDFRAEIPLGHVTLYKVDGILFSGCNFKDQRNPSNIIPSFNNVGIKSIDAKYRVWGRCTVFGGCIGAIDDMGSGWDPTIFENLYFGIYASNATSTYTINVDRCIFIDNGYGVELIDVPNAVVVRSKIKFTDLATHYYNTSAMHGVHAIACSGLTIEENDFIDEAPGTHGFGTLGMVSSDLGEQGEEIRKNTFTNLRYGNFAQGKNRMVPDGLFGLEFPCNTNSNNIYDHRVVGTLWGDPIADAGVKEVSGASLNPIGTTYTSDVTIPTPFENYYNTSVNPITNWHHISQTPDDYNITMFLSPSVTNNPCNSKLIAYPGGLVKLTPGDKIAYEDEFFGTNELLQQKEAEYADKQLDPTETAQILSALGNLAPNNKQEVRDMLNFYSPYLTTEILFAACNNTPSDYNHPWLRDLLLANIEAVTPELLSFLQTKDFPLPTPMRQAIANAVGTTYTERTVLESEISHLHATRTNIANQLLNDFQHDTISVNTDSLRRWLTLQGNILYQQQIIDSYLQDGNFTQAKSETNNLESRIGTFPAHLQIEIADFVALKRWMFVILPIPQDISRLKPADLNFLRNLAQNGSGTARYQAQNILCFFYDECDPFPIDTDPITRMQDVVEQSTIEEEQASFSIYPNPANNWVMIEFSQETYDQLQNATITVTDITGRLIHQTNLTRSTYLWETGAIHDGIYLIIISSNDLLFDTKKVVVRH